MTYFNQIFWLSALRLTINLRQKLGWLSLVVGVFLIFLARLVAGASFVGPAKIFLDFSLAMSFYFQVFISTYLASHVLSDERNRRTLFVLCAGRLSRTQWLWGQIIGIWALATLISSVWLIVSAIVCHTSFGSGVSWILLQNHVFVSIESLILISSSLLLSMFLRPALTWFLMLSLTVALHSVSSLRQILQENLFQSADLQNSYNILFKLFYVFPPLEWLDLRLFIGYEEVFDWGYFFGICSLGLLWFCLLTFAAQTKLRNLDF